MNYREITSRSNDHIKQVCRWLNTSSSRKQDGVFVLEGLRLCRDAAQNGVLAKEVYVSSSALMRYPEDVQLLFSTSKASFVVDNDVFSKMSATESSQGFLSVVSVDDIVKPLSVISTGRYVACENVADPANLGAIARTAEALGVDGMVLLGSCCDRWNPKALRASMGALLRMPIASFDDACVGIQKFKEADVACFATVVDAQAESIRDVQFHSGSMVIIGNEANGMSDSLISRCDRRVTIPIAGRSESFNAAAAAAIVLWELMNA